MDFPFAGYPLRDRRVVGDSAFFVRRFQWRIIFPITPQKRSSYSNGGGWAETTLQG
jgi:hypothetical protein